MIRRASVEDIPLIRKMAEVVFPDTYRTILSPEQLEYMMDMMYSEANLLRQMTDEGNVFFIDENRGYASVRPDGMMEDGRPRFHLEKIYVMPQCQKTGLGRQLFETVKAEASQMAAHRPYRLELNVNRNNPALQFYQHLGMFKARQGDFPIGNGYYMNDYIMALDL